jgi:hypothetical protein
MAVAQQVDELDRSVRMHVFGAAANTARVPTNPEVAAALGLPLATVEESLRRLAAGKVLVLAPNNVNVWMANPFSAVPSAFKVHSRGLTYFAPCIWDALGIPAALDTDAEIETSCGDCGAAMSLSVRARALAREEGVIHFALPALRWWENIGFT